MNAIKTTRESFPAPPGITPVRSAWPWRDIIVVIATTALSVGIAAHFQLNESLYALTRHWEHFQIDELPVGMLVLSIGLVWLAWRRFQQARHELQARRIAEVRLAGVLAQNRELAQEQVRIQELDRKHLARELHDQLGQYLNAIKLDAMSISESGGKDTAFAMDAARAIVRSVDHVHGAVSDMIGRLRPVGLDELGLLAAIEHCVDHWRQRLPETRFVLSVTGDFDGLSEALTLTVYRLIQEGLTNIYKHSGATHVQIDLQRNRSARGATDEVHLTVADNGCGMEPRTHTSRFGLRGMRERVEMAGGSFVLHSSTRKGLSFAARLPTEAE